MSIGRSRPLLLASMVFRPFASALGLYGDLLMILSVAGIAWAAQGAPASIRSQLPDTVAGWAWLAFVVLFILILIAAYRLQSHVCRLTEALPDIRCVRWLTKKRPVDATGPGKGEATFFRLEFCNQGTGPAEDVSATVTFCRDRNPKQAIVFRAGAQVFGMWFISGDREGEESRTYRDTTTLPPNGLPEMLDIAIKPTPTTKQKTSGDFRTGILPFHRDHAIGGEKLDEFLPEGPVYVSVLLRGAGIRKQSGFWFRLHGNGGGEARIEYVSGARSDS